MKWFIHSPAETTFSHVNHTSGSTQPGLWFHTSGSMGSTHQGLWLHTSGSMAPHSRVSGSMTSHSRVYGLHVQALWAPDAGSARGSGH